MEISSSLVLTEGPGWRAAVLLWLLAHLAQGASRFWAAQSQGSQHHARTHPLCQCLVVFSQGQAKPQNPPTVCASAWVSPARGRKSPSTSLGFFAWIGSSLALLQRVPGHPGPLQRETPGVCALCVWIQGQAAPGSPSELQPGWRCASALQTAGQSMSNPMLLWILLRENSKTTRSPWTPQLAPQHGVAEVFGSPLSRVEPLQCEGAL